MNRPTDPQGLIGPALIFLGISGGAFVVLIALLVWNRNLP